MGFISNQNIYAFRRWPSNSQRGWVVEVWGWKVQQSVNRTLTPLKWGLSEVCMRVIMTIIYGVFWIKVVNLRRGTRLFTPSGNKRNLGTRVSVPFLFSGYCLVFSFLWSFRVLKAEMPASVSTLNLCHILLEVTNFGFKEWSAGHARLATYSIIIMKSKVGRLR